MKPSFLAQFLGINRFRQLWSSLQNESRDIRSPRLNTAQILVAFVVALSPVLFAWLEIEAPSETISVSTLSFGVCTVLAILLRWRWRLPFRLPTSWRSSFSVTHTAVAVGCIPAVLVIAFSPSLLSDRGASLNAQPGVGHGELPSLLLVSVMLCRIALWVAVTEEILFRSLLVSAMRRWSVFTRQRSADISAIIFTSFIFGLAHVPAWGVPASIALAGLGVGFGLAYLANGEQIVPLILYHFGFDLLSLIAVVYFT